jgi:hypothetical protein
MDYDDLLNRTWDDIPEPVLLPGGTWMVAGKTAALVRPKEEGKSLKILFGLKAKEPVNVAQEELDELGDYDITINDLQHTIYIENASDWDKVRKFLAVFGVEIDTKVKIVDGNGKLSFAKAFAGAEAVAEIGQRNYQDANNETVWQNNLSKFQAVTE